MAKNLKIAEKPVKPIYPTDGWGGADGLTYFQEGIGYRAELSEERVMLPGSGVYRPFVNVKVKEVNPAEKPVAEKVSPEPPTERHQTKHVSQKRLLHPKRGNSGGGRSKVVSNVTPKIKQLAFKGMGVRAISRRLAEEGVGVTPMTVSRVLKDQAKD